MFINEYDGMYIYILILGLNINIMYNYGLILTKFYWI